MSKKSRLDQLLISLGLAADLREAQALIMSGSVIVDEHRIDKSSALVSLDANIRVKGKGHAYVSRGGLKLEHAIKTFGGGLIKDVVAIDVGASTGGFTEVLLQNGAKTVYAIDVGYGQLAEKLRQDPRVISMERTHILDIKASIFKELPSIAVIDVSFISLERVLPHVISLLAKDARIYALVKPQFEVEPKFVHGGIVKDEGVRALAVEKIVNLAKSLGLHLLGVEKSPILGAKGNQEFLLALEKTDAMTIRHIKKS
jgi:23S rRNA (cytidine1920-2'-O)/16S rRNA (cytidine1409-2'-O)-methyltransferase